MSERYEPPSDFLKALNQDDAPSSGSEHAEASLLCLIDMTRDEFLANRAWATRLLAQQDLDTPDIRSALFHAADDENGHVRAEAMLGWLSVTRRRLCRFCKRNLQASMSHFRCSQLPPSSHIPRWRQTCAPLSGRPATSSRIARNFGRSKHASEWPADVCGGGSWTSTKIVSTGQFTTEMERTRWAFSGQVSGMSQLFCL